MRVNLSVSYLDTVVYFSCCCCYYFYQNRTNSMIFFESLRVWRYFGLSHVWGLKIKIDHFLNDEAPPWLPEIGGLCLRSLKKQKGEKKLVSWIHVALRWLWSFYISRGSKHPSSIYLLLSFETFPPRVTDLPPVLWTSISSWFTEI